MTYPGPARSPRRRSVAPLVLAAMVAGATFQLGVPLAVGSLLRQSQPATSRTLPSSPATSRTPTASASPLPLQTTGPVTMTDALKRGVVMISGTTAQESVAGTGMVISDTGEILTNYHVVRSTQKITVTLASTGRKHTATLVGRDATKDVALLRLQGVRGLDVVTLDSDPVALGAVVIAAGNANGQGFITANRGNILATDQVIQVKGPTGDDPDERLTGLIETNAPGWPGDSGGPMFDAETQVLGMTTAGSSEDADERRVFAIPIASAMAVVDRIRNGDESGSVVIGPRAFLGITVTEEGGEVVIRSVDAGGPAQRAGLRADDTILSVGGTPVATRAELSTVLDGYEPGTTAEVVWRTTAGTERRGSVTFGASKVN